MKKAVTFERLFPGYPTEFKILIDYINQLDDQQVDYKYMEMLLIGSAGSLNIEIDWDFDWINNKSVDDKKDQRRKTPIPIA